MRGSTETYKGFCEGRVFGDTVEERAEIDGAFGEFCDVVIAKLDDGSISSEQVSTLFVPLNRKLREEGVLR